MVLLVLVCLSFATSLLTASLFNAISTKFVLFDFILIFIGHHTHRHGYHLLIQLIYVSFDLFYLVLKNIHAISMKQDSTDIHLRCHHLSLDHLISFQVILLQQFLFPLFILPYHKQKIICKEFDKKGDHQQCFRLELIAQEICLLSMKFKSIHFLFEIIIIDWKRVGEVSNSNFLDEIIQSAFFNNFMQFRQQDQQKQLQISKINLVIFRLSILLTDNKFRSFVFSYSSNLFLFTISLDCLGDFIKINSGQNIERLCYNNRVVRLLGKQVFFLMNLKSLLSEHIHILRKQQGKIYGNHSHSKLSNLLKIVNLLLYILLWTWLCCCGLITLRSGNWCLLIAHWIRRRRRRRIVLRLHWIYLGGLWVRQVDYSRLIILRTTAAMMLVAFVLLSHHHHVLHIHHILILKLNKGPHHFIFVLMGGGQVSLKPEFFYFILNSTNLFDQFRLVIGADISGW